MISLRLNTDLENKLNRIAKSKKLPKSEIIKQALVSYFEDFRESHSAYDLGKDLFGKYGSGKGDMSAKYKTILKEKLNEKYSR